VARCKSALRDVTEQPGQLDGTEKENKCKLTDLMGVAALEISQWAPRTAAAAARFMMFMRFAAARNRARWARRTTAATARITTFLAFAAARNRALPRGLGIRGLLALLVELAAKPRERNAGGALQVQAARETVKAIFARLASLQSRAAGKVPWRHASEPLYVDPAGFSTPVDMKTMHIYELSTLFEDINALLQGSKHCMASPVEVPLCIIAFVHDAGARISLADIHYERTFHTYAPPGV